MRPKKASLEIKPSEEFANEEARDSDHSEKEIEEARKRALKQHGADFDALGRAVSALKALLKLAEPFPAVEATCKGLD